LQDVLASQLSAGVRIVLCDAETADDLDALVHAASQVRHGRYWLWCGSAGLASALARHIGGAVPPGRCRLVLPFIGLIGSPDLVAKAQLEAAVRSGLPVVTLSRTYDESSDELDTLTKECLEHHGGLFVAAPPYQPGEAPAVRFAQRLADCAVVLTRRCMPATLILSGGDTARAVCRALGIWGLRVHGEVAPGVPLCGVLGPADLCGMRIVTKAGSFGPNELWCQLIGLPRTGADTSAMEGSAHGR